VPRTFVCIHILIVARTQTLTLTFVCTNAHVTHARYGLARVATPLRKQRFSELFAATFRDHADAERQEVEDADGVYVEFLFSFFPMTRMHMHPNPERPSMWPSTLTSLVHNHDHA
jgi:hypothetical protein